jgi:DNA-directed RNA polymerase subunit RPC12/RpoP
MLQVFMLFFDYFPTLFFVAFFIILIIIFLSALTTFLRILRRPHETQSTEERATVVKEREIIREIVKIRCPYCNNLYDEKYDKCPNCGGKRNP